MNNHIRVETTICFSILLSTISISSSDATPLTQIKVKPQQILLDTGGGGGDGANLPGTKWWFASTSNGNPFMFWTWSPS